ncbi:YSIRK-type signal peptide-containing protein [Staphylococcus pseudintermedius]|nr:YSIRK-type signal peptide-containing protein [Staphylococcus pseudintermedius]
MRKGVINCVQNEEEKHSIRKLSIGAASVIVGDSCMVFWEMMKLKRMKMSLKQLGEIQ